MSTASQVSDEQKPPFREQPPELKAKKLQVLTSNDSSRVPVVFVPHPKSQLKPAKEIKILSSRKNSLSSCTKILRERISLELDSSLQFIIGGRRILKLTDTIGDLYDAHKDKKDSFLYIQYGEIQAMGF